MPSTHFERLRGTRTIRCPVDEARVCHAHLGRQRNALKAMAAISGA
jgi:hypothetical protein